MIGKDKKSNRVEPENVGAVHTHSAPVRCLTYSR